MRVETRHPVVGVHCGNPSPPKPQRQLRRTQVAPSEAGRHSGRGDVDFFFFFFRLQRWEFLEHTTLCTSCPYRKNKKCKENKRQPPTAKNPSKECDMEHTSTKQHDVTYTSSWYDVRTYVRSDGRTAAATIVYVYVRTNHWEHTKTIRRRLGGKISEKFQNSKIPNLQECMRVSLELRITLHVYHSLVL